MEKKKSQINDSLFSNYIIEDHCFFEVYMQKKG